MLSRMTRWTDKTDWVCWRNGSCDFASGLLDREWLQPCNGNFGCWRDGRRPRHHHESDESGDGRSRYRHGPIRRWNRHDFASAAGGSALVLPDCWILIADRTRGN
jgi:hypothetical protein